MKHKFARIISGLFMLVFITITTSCAVVVPAAHQPKQHHHKNRIVWVSGVQYRQVYYIENNNVVIVSQEKHNPKPQKIKHKKGNNGKHGH